MIHDNSHNQLDDADDDGPILLHGVSVPDSDSAPTPLANDDSESPATLILRAFDDGVPGRDYQPRLLRFGEAA